MSGHLHQILAGVLVVAWMITEGLYERRKGGRQSQDRLSSEIMLVSLFLNMAVIVWVMVHGIGTIPGPAWRYQPAAIGLALGGIGLRYWAIRTLGQFFTSAVVVGEDHRLIDIGPFKWVRHPGYAGVMAFGTGVILLLGNWAGALVYLFGHGLSMHYRISVEERALHAQLGDAYESYARRTWRMVPFVY